MIKELSEKASQRVKQQFKDNAYWIERVEAYQLVVGSEARILYMNAEVSINLIFQIIIMYMLIK